MQVNVTLAGWSFTVTLTHDDSGDQELHGNAPIAGPFPSCPGFAAPVGEPSSN